MSFLCHFWLFSMSFLSFYVIPKPSRVYFALKIFQNQLENVVFEEKCIFFNLNLYYWACSDSKISIFRRNQSLERCRVSTELYFDLKWGFSWVFMRKWAFTNRIKLLRDLFITCYAQNVFTCSSKYVMHNGILSNIWKFWTENYQNYNFNFSSRKFRYRIFIYHV